jgi:hypothetical protein
MVKTLGRCSLMLSALVVVAVLFLSMGLQLVLSVRLLVGSG